MLLFHQETFLHLSARKTPKIRPISELAHGLIRQRKERESFFVFISGPHVTLTVENDRNIRKWNKKYLRYIF